MIDGAVSVALGWLVEKVADEAVTRTTENAIKRVLRKRADAAREIALEEIAAGRGHVLLDAPAQDEAVAILWRYLRAAEEGAARINLRLMASILAGKREAPPIYADEFLRWAELIESLTELEIVLLATLHRECSGPEPKLADEATRRELIPGHFSNDNDFNLAAFALIRTGLIVQTGILFAPLDDAVGGVFRTSPRMAELMRIADVEGALHRERASRKTAHSHS